MSRSMAASSLASVGNDGCTAPDSMRPTVDGDTPAAEASWRWVKFRLMRASRSKFTDDRPRAGYGEQARA